ncbi:hypothetical protein BGZ60DRAFT_418839 [Tricladium varicosporioides]|nr:hypothetical protein BGZ60DRAFT_418839 [Hymenoscyphus varicosporioides]
MAQPITSQAAAVTSAISYLLVHEDNVQCFSPTDASLWFTSLMTAAVLWNYVLGASDIRRWIHYKLGRFSNTWKFEGRCGIGIFGSLFLQLSMTLLTASILQHANKKTDLQYHGLRNPFAAWYLRPLPGTAISLSSLISPNVYLGNVAAVSLVESLYSLGSIAFYIELHRRSSVALHLANLSQPLSNSTSGSKPTSTYISEPTSQPTSTIMSNDRTCGSQNKYTCRGSSWGTCCSQYGWCGSDLSFCGTGCQHAFGDCLSAITVRRAISLDGICGAPTGNTCFSSTHGQCCSSSNFCGDTISYCGVGCQASFGLCTPTTSLTTQASTSSLELLQIGSIVGISYTAILFMGLIANFFLYVSTWNNHGPFFSPTRRKRAPKIIAAIFVPLNAWHLSTSFILWNAALQVAPGVFCPSTGTVSKITVLWVFVPAIDHFWRALF